MRRWLKWKTLEIQVTEYETKLYLSQKCSQSKWTYTRPFRILRVGQVFFNLAWSADSRRVREELAVALKEEVENLKTCRNLSEAREVVEDDVEDVEVEFGLVQGDYLGIVLHKLWSTSTPHPPPRLIQSRCVSKIGHAADCLVSRGAEQGRGKYYVGRKLHLINMINTFPRLVEH